MAWKGELTKGQGKTCLLVILTVLLLGCLVLTCVTIIATGNPLAAWPFMALDCGLLTLIGKTLFWYSTPDEREDMLKADMIGRVVDRLAPRSEKPSPTEPLLSLPPAEHPENKA